jgi:hypothetical protein
MHDFDPTVLIDTDADEAGNADDIVWSIEAGRCPRCGQLRQTRQTRHVGS